MTAAPAVDIRGAQRRTLTVLSAGQALGGLSNGVALGVGALLVEQVTGDPALAGLAATMLTLGGALLAVPLARLADRRGRRVSLTTGALIALAGALLLALGGTLGAAWIVLPGFSVLGASTAINLQSRFAATDLSEPRHRGRDLSLVVWMTTLGVIIGPNLIPAGDALGTAMELPHLVGAYLISAAALVVAATLLWTGLRPDPLLTARGLVEASDRVIPALRLLQHPRALAAVVAIACAQATMVGIMALTPVHLEHDGHGLAMIGLTMSAHTAGMYALAPVFGWLTDRIGARWVAVGGAAMLAASVGTALALESLLAPVPLALLGLGWSAATVAGSTIVAGAVPADLRPALQGRSDLVMGLSGAAAGALAGPVLGVVGYAGLNLATLPVIAAVAVAAIIATRPAGGSREPVA
ncbi:MFS transporter [Agrococcus carbonis]|uniref:Predicted arabinose efflux permease, MFS family n=1 Tax=Agrococcus carbonis TaxID=684552 RepID=A0A1H1SBK7_9MICO|nr:MFS transporter [Agrococcus carbonis]SDS45342.1 Predicted arabinose efflux permease, MFS family [Agrococcus carbonis]